MTQNIIKITKQQMKNQFFWFGFTMIIYGLIVLLAQNFVPYVMDFLYSNILADVSIRFEPYIALGIRCLIVIIGSFIPFMIFGKAVNIKLNEFFKKPKIKISALLSNTILITGIYLFCIFIFSLVAILFGQDAYFILPIGINIEEFDIYNPVFLTLVVIIIPLVEEFVFRGVGLRFLSRYGNFFGIIAISVLYGLAHGNLIDSLPAFVYSIMLCILTLRYKSNVVAAFVHICGNAFMVLINMLVTVNYLWVFIIIGVIYLATIAIAILNWGHRVIVKKDDNTNRLFGIFFTNPAIIVCIILFVCTSFIHQFIVF